LPPLQLATAAIHNAVLSALLGILANDRRHVHLRVHTAGSVDTHSLNKQWGLLAKEIWS